MHRLGGRLLNVAHRRDCPSVSTVSVYLTSGFYCFAQEPARQPIEVTYLHCSPPDPGTSCRPRTADERALALLPSAYQLVKEVAAMEEVCISFVPRRPVPPRGAR